MYSLKTPKNSMDNAKEYLCLRSASIAARGLWFDISLITELHSKDGKLPVDRDHLARIAGVERRVVDSLIDELRRAGVLEVLPSGEIYSSTLEHRAKLRAYREKAAQNRRQRRAAMLAAVDSEISRP
jgi:hypothetical protein